MALLSRSLRAVALAAALAAPMAAHAQGATVSRAPLARGVGIQLLQPTAPAPAPVPNPFSVLTAEGKMAWGGVAIIVGAVVGGDSGKIIEIGGAGIGLWGLFQFLK
jgi:hypothetical protein